jgi:hypothetical protein
VGQNGVLFTHVPEPSCVYGGRKTWALGSHVAHHGWSGSVELTSQCRTEFSPLLPCLSAFNGQHIHTAYYGITIDLDYQSFESIVSAVSAQYVQ